MLVALGALSGCSLTGKEFEDKLNHNIVYLQTHAHLHTHTHRYNPELFKNTFHCLYLIIIFNLLISFLIFGFLGSQNLLIYWYAVNDKMLISFCISTA